ncbi:hypothetical protein PENSUB_9172 [Penicillium subrubescens]|uniref:Magnesium transport protein CorA n=1 Tax=Penicillium subrubescens TaxID=1316194 RepID=A0A1Q5TE40_9EURO|nr:hypothetical protein PENSUB_9172 [Penicillium subrubescens]
MLGTAEEYVKAIAHHSQQSSAETLYPGEIYETLKRFLEHKSSDESSNFAWLVSPSSSSQQTPSDKQSLSDKHSMFDTTRNPGRSEGFSEPDPCVEALKSNIEISHPQVLFLRGHPSPNWISKIGAFCYADPELFRWFLRYRSEQAIACTDAGHNFTQGPPLPWLRDEPQGLPVTLLPIIQYKTRCALKSRSINDSDTGSAKERNTQSLAIFPEGYGRGLDWSLAKSDRFHILSDVFRLAAFSQKQLLNVMKEKILNETDRLSLSDENPTLTNLLYFRNILQDQLSTASYMLQLTDDQTCILQNGRRSISTDQKSMTDCSLAEMHSIFQDLHSQAELLYEKCNQGMTVISNKSMLAESQRAIQQAKLVTKLTIVAFVYLPFTFTAGFFGMNFRELGNGSISLWIFFAVSLPLMFITMAVFILDERKMKSFLRILGFAEEEDT